MANTQTFDQVVEQISSTAISTTRPAMPELALYCTLIRLDAPIVDGKANIPVITGVQAVLTDPSTYENSADTIEGRETEFVSLSAQFGFNAPDQSRGLDLQMVLQSHLTAIESKVQSLVNAVITEANFAAATVTTAAATYSMSDCETLLAAVPSRTILALKPDYFVKTKSDWLPAGEEGIARELSDTTSIGTNIVGFAARPEAVALFYGYPQIGNSREIKTSKIRLPIGLDVQFSRWWSRGGRSWRGSLDICIAPAVGQTGALRVINKQP